MTLLQQCMEEDIGRTDRPFPPRRIKTKCSLAALIAAALLVMPVGNTNAWEETPLRSAKSPYAG